jgi:hypothetical protein
MSKTMSRLAALTLSSVLTLASIVMLIPAKEVEAVDPAISTFFATAYVEESDTYNTKSQGDLWASCWSDDDYLYSSNGDGNGFTVKPNEINSTPSPGTAADIAMNRISGSTNNITGKTIAKGNSLGKVWDTSGSYNRKPTGMVCVDGNLYLAVQDLNKDFNDAPNASISKSTDKGVTWTFDTTSPMFSNYLFTTIMFLDYGKNNQNAIDSYVYAYGLDYNWRDSFNDRVEDPTKLFLARVPKTSIQDRSKWEFYTGTDSSGNTTWSNDIGLKTPVLQDDRRVYQSTRDPDSPSNMTVISQGSVVYNKPLNRYIYTSWTEYTFEFYEAPQPWGPWKHFLTKDYGGYPWSDTKNGGYATTIPSKFISTDGKTMYLQSNTFMGGTSNYNFSVRKLTVEPFVSTTPSNSKDSTNNLAITGDGTTPMDKVAHFGNVVYFNNGIRNENEDSWDQENKTTDWWGYTWKRAYNINRVVYTTGEMFSDGGWYSSGLKVQVRQNFNWVDVTGLSVTPNYPYNSTAGTNTTYTFTFDDTWGDGVRIMGTPGGSAYFTSIGELEVYYY